MCAPGSTGYHANFLPLRPFRNKNPFSPLHARDETIDELNFHFLCLIPWGCPSSPLSQATHANLPILQRTEVEKLSSLLCCCSSSCTSWARWWLPNETRARPTNPGRQGKVVPAVKGYLGAVLPQPGCAYPTTPCGPNRNPAANPIKWSNSMNESEKRQHALARSRYRLLSCAHGDGRGGCWAGRKNSSFKVSHEREAEVGVW